MGRFFIDLRGQEKKWYKDAEKVLKKALKRQKGHELATYYMGEMYLYKYEFSNAEDNFRMVVDMKGEYAGKADNMWQLSQKLLGRCRGRKLERKLLSMKK